MARVLPGMCDQRARGSPGSQATEANQGQPSAPKRTLPRPCACDFPEALLWAQLHPRNEGLCPEPQATSLSPLSLPACESAATECSLSLSLCTVQQHD